MTCAINLLTVLNVKGLVETLAKKIIPAPILV